MCTERLYSFAEAAGLLNVSESTLRKKVAAGRAPHRKVFRHVRFNSADLQAMQDVVVPTLAVTSNGRRRSRSGQPASCDSLAGCSALQADVAAVVRPQVDDH